MPSKEKQSLEAGLSRAFFILSLDLLFLSAHWHGMNIFLYHDVSALLQAKNQWSQWSKNWNIGSSEPKQTLTPFKLFFHSNRKWLALSFLITPPGELSYYSGMWALLLSGGWQLLPPMSFPFLVAGLHSICSGPSVPAEVWNTTTSYPTTNQWTIHSNTALSSRHSTIWATRHCPYCWLCQRDY